MTFNEIAASLYPWDIADEGIDRVLDTLQERTYCNSAYLIALMHHEKRPLTDYYYPHNPKRKTYFPEDSRAYWQPDWDHYADSRIKPVVSTRDFLKDKDWLEVLIAATRARGMRTGVEISHTPLDKERAATEFSDCIQQDIFGNRLGQRLCPNSPDARTYIIKLFTDVARYDVDMIQTCMLLYASGHANVGNPELNRLMGIFLGGCFCDNCGRAAESKGLDWQAIKRRARQLADVLKGSSPEGFHAINLIRGSNLTAEAFLMEEPLLYEWLRLRIESVTALFKDIYEAVKAVKPNIDLRYNHHTFYPEVQGLDLRAMSPYLDSIRSSNYSEQLGKVEEMENKRKMLLNMRRAIGDLPMNSAIAVRPKATPELVRMGVRISAECGADGISLGHYDGAWYEHLDAIKQGIEEAQIEIPWA